MILLDTGAWIAWVSQPARLSAKAQRAIAEEERRQGIHVSAMSAWEVATKCAQGKLVLDRDVRAWIHFASNYPGLSVLPVSAADAVEATLLPGSLPDDPVDRLIVAAARRLDCPLVTSDPALRAYRHVKTLW